MTLQFLKEDNLAWSNLLYYITIVQHIFKGPEEPYNGTLEKILNYSNKYKMTDRMLP